MFCSKCGTRVADDDYACYMCGARLNNNVRSALDILREEEARENKRKEQISTEPYEASEPVFINDDPIEATVREMFENGAASFETENNEDIEYMHSLIGDRDKKVERESRSRVPLVVGIPLVVLAAAAGGVFLWLKRPEKIIDEAVQTEDIQMVSELYDKLPDEEQKEEIKVSMIGRARELRDQYLNEEITYDEVMAEFDLLKDNVFDDSAEFEEMTEQIERINTSRLAFEKAERSFARAKYPDAIDSYREVIMEDEKYYERAQEGINNCNEAVLLLVKGTWRYEYDAHREVQQYVKEKGFDIDLSKMKIPINFLFELKDDSSIEVSVDYDALNEYIDKVLDLAVETMSKGASEAIPGNADLSAILKGMYNSSGIKDNIKEQLNIQGALDNLLKEAGVDKIDSYRVEDGHLYIGTACMDVSVEDTTMTLTSKDSEALAVGQYKMPYPIKMEKVEDKDNAVDETDEEASENKDTDSKNKSNGSKNSKTKTGEDNDKSDELKDDETEIGTKNKKTDRSTGKQ
ncbi:MAG: hypothetical protein IKP31_03320 [Lachnospiraceae bacterium]|nr:hypothetical protein [Lachnospiraceae bacterium]